MRSMRLDSVSRGVVNVWGERSLDWSREIRLDSRDGDAKYETGLRWQRGSYCIAGENIGLVMGA